MDILCRNLCHVNILHFHGSVIMSRSPMQFGLVFDWCDRSLADEFINACGNVAPSAETHDTVVSIVRQILHALDYLHSKGIGHFGLNTSNILVRTWLQLV